MRLGMATRFLRFPLLLAMIGLPSAAQDSNLLLLYREAQTAQAAGQLAAATEKYEAIVRMRPDMPRRLRIWVISTISRASGTWLRPPIRRRFS